MKQLCILCCMLLVLTAELNGADVDNMISWKEPCVVEWTSDAFRLGGILPRQVQHLCLWSLEDASLLWFVRARRRLDYEKGSRTNSVFCLYGVPLKEWEQLYPKVGKPRSIRENEVVCVSLSWSYPFMFGMRGDIAEFYYRRKGNVFESLTPTHGKVANMDVAVFRDEQARVITLLESNWVRPDDPLDPPSKGGGSSSPHVPHEMQQSPGIVNGSDDSSD